MVSTVTTTTVTTVTTIAALGFTATISMAAVIALVAFLGVREMASHSSLASSRLIARFLSVGVVPLVMTFVVSVVVQIAAILA